MGYNTSFEGEIVLSRPFSENEEDWFEMLMGDEYNGWIFNGWWSLQYEDGFPDSLHGKFLWDGSEKTYDMKDQIKELIHLLKTHPTAHDIVLNGSFLAQGEEIGDIWRLDVKDNEVTRTDILTDTIECPSCQHRFKLK